MSTVRYGTESLNIRTVLSFIFMLLIKKKYFHSNTHTHTHIHTLTHTYTHIHKHIQTQTQKHVDTSTHRHIHTDTWLLLYGMVRHGQYAVLRKKSTVRHGTARHGTDIWLLLLLSSFNSIFLIVLLPFFYCERNFEKHEW